MATMVRASGYGARYVDYRDESKHTLLSILQIESAEGVRNVEEVAAVDGVDVLFIGPMDLSTSLSVFRQYDHPLFVDAVAKTIEAAQRHGRALGILLGTPADYRKYYDLGFRFIMYGTDVLFLRDAAQAAARALRAG